MQRTLDLYIGLIINKKYKMDIVENSKMLAKYLGWEYIPLNDLQGFSKPGWYRVTLPLKGATIVEGKCYSYVCRSHKDLRFYNSMDWLIKILDKLTDENLSKHMYSWERCINTEEEGCKTEMCYNFMNVDYYISKEFGTIIEINLELDPALTIGHGEGENIIKNTFNACVQAVEYINEIKSENR